MDRPKPGPALLTRERLQPTCRRGKGFDFYVLALSWSPAYCQIEGSNANRKQCAEDRDLGFVVHGLWPQFETGYPEFCPTRQPDRVPADLGGDYLDIVPSMGLIGPSMAQARHVFGPFPEGLFPGSARRPCAHPGAFGIRP